MVSVLTRIPISSDNMSIKQYRYLMVALLIVWMLVIFMFSAQNSTVSSSVSEGFSYRLFSFINPDFKTMSAEEQETFLESIMTPIRKLAHFTLYFILGLIASGLFVTIKNRGMLLKSAVSWGICVLYAVSDEIHQYFVPGRACAAFDVFIDSLGAGLAVALFALAICVIKPLKRFKNFK